MSGTDGTPVVPVSSQQDGPRQRLSRSGEERRLKQTPDLIPAGQRLSGSCGEPHRHPAGTALRLVRHSQGISNVERV